MAETLATVTKDNLKVNVLGYAGLAEDFTDMIGASSVMGRIATKDRTTQERRSGHIRSVSLSIEPDISSGLSRMRIGDTRKSGEGSMVADQGVSINAVVARRLLAGMRTDSEGAPGRFTYKELLETSRRGDVATTAEDIGDVIGEDLVMFVNPDGMVVIGMADQGPAYGVTGEDWALLTGDVSGNRGTLDDFVGWAHDVGSEMLRRDSDLEHGNYSRLN